MLNLSLSDFAFPLGLIGCSYGPWFLLSRVTKRRNAAVPPARLRNFTYLTPNQELLSIAARCQAQWPLSNATNLRATSLLAAAACVSSHHLSPDPESDYIPFEMQHLLFTQVQSKLEATLFAFGTRWEEEKVHRAGWTCAQMVSVRQWSEMLVNLSDTDKNLLASAVEMHDSLVDRTMMPLSKVEKLLKDAADLSGHLGGVTDAVEIHELKEKVLKGLEEWKKLVRPFWATLDEKLKDIECRAAGLVEEEIRARKEYGLVAQRSLQRVLGRVL